MTVTVMNPPDDSPLMPEAPEPGDEAAFEAMRADWCELLADLAKCDPGMDLETRLKRKRRMNEFLQRHLAVLKMNDLPDWQTTNPELRPHESLAEMKPHESLEKLKATEIELLRTMHERWGSMSMPDRIAHSNVLRDLHLEETIFIFMLPTGQQEDWLEERRQRLSENRGLDFFDKIQTDD